ncbi:MAG: 3-deoxy-8-phosphooctulonate synthase [Candidatus Hydrogenedentes bacterium]|nr:3-deoxy-8-phosphooctulonate synthase [Candidatus Hydrogenedentota bacterium]
MDLWSDILGSGDLFFIMGPCVIESRGDTLNAAYTLRDIAERCDVPIVFKSSFDKANRSSSDSFRGPGLEEGLAVLEQVREETGLAVTTDVHSVEQVESVAGTVDLIQIPAFLCRQTDLLVEVGRSGVPVNIKKGQFMAPWDMANTVHKVAATGNSHILLTERGTTFGYNNLVVDMRSIPIMRSFGYPVVFDATHSVQLPGGAGRSSSGERHLIEPIACAGVAAGCDGVFIEVHRDPDRAKCDGPNSLALDDVANLIETLKRVRHAVRNGE